MTHGDADKIRCPHCGKANSIAALLADMVRGAIREFEHPCAYCKMPVYYWARWIIGVDAEKPSKVK
jgi:hypothetical protein